MYVTSTDYDVHSMTNCVSSQSQPQPDIGHGSAGPQCSPESQQEPDNTGVS